MIRDTTPDAAAMQTAIYRRMSGTQRCAIAAQMSETARQVTLAGIRQRHPEYDAAHARWALYRLLLGDELFSRAWPHSPRLEP